jgi:hypothetical protein
MPPGEQRPFSGERAAALRDRLAAPGRLVSLTPLGTRRDAAVPARRGPGGGARRRAGECLGRGIAGHDGRALPTGGRGGGDRQLAGRPRRHARSAGRYPKEHALASHVRHPGNVYLREAGILRAIDKWLAVIFAPHQFTRTIRGLAAAQDPAATPEPAGTGEDTRATIDDCDARLAHRPPRPRQVIANCDVKMTRYRAAIDTGDPEEITAGSTRPRPGASQAEAALRATSTAPTATRGEIKAIVERFASLAAIVRRPARRTRPRSTRGWTSC